MENFSRAKAYKKYYGQGVDVENFYQNEIQPLLKFIQQKFE